MERNDENREERLERREEREENRLQRAMWQNATLWWIVGIVTILAIFFCIWIWYL